MNLIVVDASQKKAAVRSRRELSKWLTQLGADVFCGRLSQEGLKDLVEALRAQASRHTSIAIHRVASRDRLALVTIVGNREAFDSEGRWAFRSRTMVHDKSSRPPLLQLLGHVACLSGLVHDLGKVNLQLQRTLRGEPDPQQVRHDVLGALMFREAVVRSFNKHKAGELGWLEDAAARPQEFFAHLVDAATGEILLSATSRTHLLSDTPAAAVRDDFLDKALCPPKLRKQLPVYTCAAWLTLTHHHLPRLERADKSESKQSIEPRHSLWRHIQESLPRKPENLRAPVKGLPWQDKQWLEAFVACVQAIVTLLREHPDLGTQLSSRRMVPLMASLVHVLRPALIMADQSASVMQQDVLDNGGRGRAFEDGVLYANSWKKQTGLAGDSLTTHLRSVGRKARFFTQLLVRPALGLFPTAQAPQVWSGSQMALPLPPDSRFYWQQAAEDAVAAQPEARQAPFFAAVLSAPGSGKTAGGPRLLKAACGDEMRFSLAVGRKNLTLQTGQAYEQQLNFSRKDLAVMVGDAGARMLFEADAKNRADRTSLEQGAPQEGSECLVDDGPQLLLQDEQELLTREPGPWLEVVQPKSKLTNGGQGFLDAKRQRLVDAPVLVATVDHLMGAALMTRTRDSHLLLRVATSDLILDEIDDYSTNDLVSLGKLAFLSGLYGRRVLVMSATMSDYLSTQLHACWAQGLAIHRMLSGNRVPSLVALVSNHTAPVILREPDAETFAVQAHRFCSVFAQELHARAGKVRNATLALTRTGRDEKPRWCEEVLAASLGLHHAHATTDPITGVRLSIGAVRFNRVGHAQQFAKHLLNRPEQDGEPLTRVVCYHARYPALMRALMERAIDGFLLREKDTLPSGQEFQEHPVLRRTLNEAARQQRTDVLIVLATTSIEETGRNHDLDWAIAEPHSERSLAQLGGRLLRHRLKLPTCPNLLVLDTTLNVVTSATGAPYARTGVQDHAAFQNTKDWLVEHPAPASALSEALRRAGIQHEAPQEPGPAKVCLLAEQLLPFSSWQGVVSPSTALLKPAKYEDQRLASLQFIQLQGALESSTDPAQPSLQEYFDSADQARPLWLSSVHQEVVGFRDSTSWDQEVCIDPQDDERFVLVNQGVPSQIVIRHTEPAVLHPERDLLQMADSWRSDFEALCQANGWNRNSAIYLLGKGSVPWSKTTQDAFNSDFPCFDFHPSLGFGRRATK